MLIAGLVNIVVGLCLGVYSGFSIDTRLMRFNIISWFPVARFYKRALNAISKLEVMKQAESDYYATAEGRTEEFGIVNDTTEGFNEIVFAMKKGGMLNQAVDSMELIKHTYQGWDSTKAQPITDVSLRLKFIKDHKTVKELPIDSIQSLKSAVDRVVQRRFALLTIGLSVILFLTGMILIYIDIKGKQ